MWCGVFGARQEREAGHIVRVQDRRVNLRWNPIGSSFFASHLRHDSSNLNTINTEYHGETHRELRVHSDPTVKRWCILSISLSPRFTSCGSGREHYLHSAEHLLALSSVTSSRFRASRSMRLSYQFNTSVSASILPFLQSSPLLSSSATTHQSRVSSFDATPFLRMFLNSSRYVCRWEGKCDNTRGQGGLGIYATFLPARNSVAGPLNHALSAERLSQYRHSPASFHTRSQSPVPSHAKLFLPVGPEQICTANPAARHIFQRGHNLEGCQNGDSD